MFIEITVRVDGREAGTVAQELTGSGPEIEEQLLKLQQRPGRMVLERAFAQLSEQTPVPCCCGRKMKHCDRRTITVQTTNGPVPVTRVRYRCTKCGHESTPADAHWCCGRHRITRPLAQRVCQLATVEHFTRLEGLVADQHGVRIGRDTLQELVHDVGGFLDRLRQAEARRIQRHNPAAAPPPRVERPPSRIYVYCDGIMYCTNQREPDPQHPEQKRLVWQQMKVGCVCWEDERGGWHKQMTWGRESPAQFGAALYRLACQCGYEQAQERIFAADGGEWCWDIHAQHFSAAVGILDWYHVSQHVWTAAKALSADDAATRAWSDQALQRLRHAGGAALVDWLQTQRASHRGRARKALKELLGYLQPRLEHLDYPHYRQKEWQIGTGMIESTCKQLVGLRLKGPGMHWTEAGALAVTALRATELNGQWQPFWKNLALAT